MNGKLSDKIKELEQYLDELSSILPNSLDEYKANFEKKAACERYFEKIIEAIVDVSFLIISEKGLKIPEEDKEAFDILMQENILSAELAQRLKDAKGMRNILAHQYGVVDDEIVFQSITEELERDAEEFLTAIKKKMR